MQKASKIILLNVSITLVVIGYIALSLWRLGEEGSAEQMSLKSLKVEVVDSTTVGFLRPEILRQKILDSIAPIGAGLDSVELWGIEKIVMEDPYVDSCWVWVSVWGEVSVGVRERKAILRIQTQNMSDSLQKNPLDFYVDNHLNILPPVKWYKPAVPTITGNFKLDTTENQKKSPKNTEKIKKLINFAKLLTNDQYLESLIAQTYIEETGDKLNAILVLNLGCNRVLLGDIAHPGAKIEKLSKFLQTAYKTSKITPTTEIDARFKDQIILRNKK